MIKRIIFFCCVIALIHGASFAEQCQHIANIKTVIVHDDAITVKFDFDRTRGDGVVQVMDVIGSDGEIRDSAFSDVKVLREGETLRWGDGDHVFHSLKLFDVTDQEAILEVGFEHRPPASHLHLAKHDVVRCDVTRSPDIE